MWEIFVQVLRAAFSVARKTLGSLVTCVNPEGVVDKLSLHEVSVVPCPAFSEPLLWPPLRAPTREALGNQSLAIWFLLNTTVPWAFTPGYLEKEKQGSKAVSLRL